MIKNLGIEWGTEYGLSTAYFLLNHGDVQSFKSRFQELFPIATEYDIDDFLTSIVNPIIKEELYQMGIELYDEGGEEYPSIGYIIKTPLNEDRKLCAEIILMEVFIRELYAFSKKFGYRSELIYTKSLDEGNIITIKRILRRSSESQIEVNYIVSSTAGSVEKMILKKYSITKKLAKIMIDKIICKNNYHIQNENSDEFFILTKRNINDVVEFDMELIENINKLFENLEIRQNLLNMLFSNRFKIHIGINEFIITTTLRDDEKNYYLNVDINENMNIVAEIQKYYPDVGTEYIKNTYKKYFDTDVGQDIEMKTNMKLDSLGSIAYCFRQYMELFLNEIAKSNFK